MDSSKERYTYHFVIAATIVVVAYILLYAVLEQGVFSHSVYDSYTRQAAVWWQGSASLPEDVSWLEIAEYNGQYFISFPPFPSVAQFLVYPIFGMDTPDNLINTLFALGTFVLIYRFLMRQGQSGFFASVFALLMTLGSNLFYLSLTGWVWFSAQTQSFFFCVLCICLIYSKRRVAWYFSFLCLGIAFACRPFQIVYAPLLFYMLYQNVRGDQKSGIAVAVRCIKYVLPLVFAGVCVAAYNYIRFGSILEFGHNYLPEFLEEPQFLLSYIPENFLEILKLPGIANGQIVWPKFNGTLFFLVNPVYILLIVSLLKTRWSLKKGIYLFCLAAHFVLMLSHRTMGGWQFGSRYLIDIIPFMLVMFADDKRYQTQRVSKAAVLPAVLLAVGVAINVWGAVWFYTSA